MKKDVCFKKYCISRSLRPNRFLEQTFCIFYFSFFGKNYRAEFVFYGASTSFHVKEFKRLLIQLHNFLFCFFNSIDDHGYRQIVTKRVMLKFENEQKNS